MRFKAKLSISQIHLLQNLINPISRLSGSSSQNNTSGSVRRSTNGENAALSIYRNGGGQGSVIYLDPNHIRISTKAKTGGEGDGIICFAELTAKNDEAPQAGTAAATTATAGIFLEHRIESAADNVIVFEIDLTQLKMALQSILENKAGGTMSSNRSSAFVAPLHNSNADDANPTSPATPAPYFMNGSVIILKLAKRNGLPCLCLDSAAAGGSVEIHHAIPVRIMRADEMQYHLPPQISMPDVQLQLPSDRPLKPVIERLKAISPQGKKTYFTSLFYCTMFNFFKHHNNYFIIQQSLLKDPWQVN